MRKCDMCELLDHVLDMITQMVADETDHAWLCVCQAMTALWDMYRC